MHPFMHSDSSKNVASKWANKYIFKLCQYINQKPNFESLWVLKKFNHLLLLQMESLEERLELSHVFLPVSLIIIVSGYLELKLDELGLIRVDLIV